MSKILDVQYADDLKALWWARKFSFLPKNRNKWVRAYKFVFSNFQGNTPSPTRSSPIQTRAPIIYTDGAIVEVPYMDTSAEHCSFGIHVATPIWITRMCGGEHALALAEWFDVIALEFQVGNMSRLSSEDVRSPDNLKFRVKRAKVTGKVWIKDYKVYTENPWNDDNLYPYKSIKDMDGLEVNKTNV